MYVCYVKMADRDEIWPRGRLKSGITYRILFSPVEDYRGIFLVTRAKPMAEASIINV